MSMTSPNGAIPSWDTADRLIKARKVADHGRGITQAELGRRLGISERTVKRYEAEGANTKRGLILGWALACGVNPQWLETGIAPRDNGPDLGSTHSGCNEITPLRPRRPRETATYSAPARRAS